MRPFKFLKNNLFHFVVLNRSEYEDVVVDLIVHQIINNLNITDACRTFTDNLTLHNNEIKILQVEALVDYFTIHYRVLDLVTGITTRYFINDFDYRTINRLVDEARV
jgi:hypothetical protein